MNLERRMMDTREFSNQRLGVNFTTERPISADDLADSFKGVSALYRREVARNTNGDLLEGAEFLLYITKIESKCIDAELAAFAASALPVVQAMDYTLIIDSFQRRFRELVSRFSFRRVLPPGSDERAISLTEAKEFAKVIKAAGCGGVKMERRFYRSSSEFTVEETLVFTPAEIRSALDGVSEFIEETTQTEDADRKMVALYLNRLDRDHHSGTGRSPERGTIESISSKPLPVHWLSDLDSIKVKSIKEANLFDLVFTVDVKVDSVKGRPVAYRVLKLHRWEPLDDSPELTD